MGGVMVRDPRVNGELIREALDSKEQRHAARRARVESAVLATDKKTVDIGAGFGSTLAGDGVRAVRYAYALGEGTDRLHELVARAATERVLCFSVMERYDAEFYPGSLGNTYGFDQHNFATFQDSVDMLSWAVLFADPAVGAAEYGLPSVTRWGDAVLDSLALFAGVADVVPREHVAVPQLWAPWLRMLECAPDERAAALEAYVRPWREIGLRDFGGRIPGSDNDTGRWCFDAAAIAVALDIDDSGVRDVPEYPGDLVDYRRGLTV